MQKIKRNLAKKELKIEINEEKTKVNRGKLKDGEIDVDLSLENRPMSIVKGERRIGCSKGITLNLGNYQSARLSVWMEKVTEDDDRIAEGDFINLSKQLNDWLQSEVDEFQFESKE